MADRNASPTSTSSADSCTTVETAPQPPSRSSSAASPEMSTPPTSLGDEASVLSDPAKADLNTEMNAAGPVSPALHDAAAAQQPTPDASTGSRRPARSSRASVTTYNVQILAGTAIHTPTKYLEKHHKNVLHGSLEDLRKTNPAPSPKRRRSMKAKVINLDDIDDPAEAQLAIEAAQAAQRRNTSRLDLRKEAFRNLTAAGDAVGARGAGILSTVRNTVQNALRGASALSRSQNDQSDDATDQEEKQFLKPKTKNWEHQGLYIGQERTFDARRKESQNRLRGRVVKSKESKILPLPMFAGERMLSGDYQRDFKLPYDVYNPLPKKVKVDGWTKLSRNRFIGDSAALWKREKQDSSSCTCSPEEGCGEACHNRIMAYECDETNCKLTPEQCGNRPFAQLKKRAKGNKYDYGVEVMETPDKGYGVRAMRTFEPHQIIVEYAGEIITMEECERRMKQVYKKDKCYYLMSFDNKMIIDATRGTIARFVNHSCEPNCEMIKWTVGGEPRMALFAGSRGIMTGEELTYDYNFDPFSLRNVQKCCCGTERCRGVLGPKPKHQAQPSLASTFLTGTKRKLQEMFGSGSGSSSTQSSPKKRRLNGMNHAALTKKENALAQNVAAQEKAKKEAAEQAAQKASRENRALRRSSSMTLTTHRSKTVHTTSRRSLPSLLSKRQGALAATQRTPKALTRQLQHKASVGSLGKRVLTGKVAKLSGSRSSVLKRNVAARKDKGAAESMMPPRSPTPEDDVVMMDEEQEDETINITPASLRSAKRKTLPQTSLPFGSAKQTARRTSKQSATPASRAANTDPFEVPDSDDEGAVVEEAEGSEHPTPRTKRRDTMGTSTTATPSSAKAKKTPTRKIAVGHAPRGRKSIDATHVWEKKTGNVRDKKTGRFSKTTI
ncbi:uncharacterized protein EI97DRAFT_84793 [Westerdykella ornata]|uniref:SET domain-containing protein n=1 Tax=Westerdykella ornata TaxID=318751 RepID=A0A6A6JJG6_WESOR|nr:uncharacterized protein EI97DRAFT_84793 [Westerdykella ornata]KAF2275009.1 hypothetical protein EI97DRAFT_84793 [Westerdykella ornata]